LQLSLGSRLSLSKLIHAMPPCWRKRYRVSNATSCLCSD
jgi:hypothetical protein